MKPKPSRYDLLLAAEAVKRRAAAKEKAATPISAKPSEDRVGTHAWNLFQRRFRMKYKLDYNKPLKRKYSGMLSSAWDRVQADPDKYKVRTSTTICILAWKGS